MSILFVLAPAIVAALVSYALTPLAEILAIRIGAIDQPGPRKIHHAPVARGGGLAVIGASAIVVCAVYGVRRHVGPGLFTDLWPGIGCGLLPIVVVSICDDIKALRASQKFIAQVLGAVIAVWLGISLSRDVHLFGQTIAIGFLAVPLSVVWLVGLTNAFNIVDGLDGLSAGLGLISSLSLGCVFILVGQTGTAVAVLVIAGALAGFLPYNIYPARMFLGDTGATAVGFCLAAFALRGGATLSAGFAVLLPAFVLGLPIAETLISMARRLLKRLQHKSVGGMFQPDRNHLHHRLLALGITHQRAVFVLYGAGFLLACGALASMLMTTLQAALLALALLLAGSIGIARLGYEEFAIIKNGVVLRLYDVPVLKKSMFVVFVDLLIVAIAAYGAVVLKTDDWSLVTFRGTVFLMIGVLAPINVVVFSRLGIYRGSWRLADARDFARASCAVVVAALLALTGQVLLTQSVTVSAVPLFSIYTLLSLVLVTGSRASYQVLSAMRRTALHGTTALIYGAGRKGARAFQELASNSNTTLRPVAFIDDDPDKAGKLVGGLPVLGSLRTLETIVRRSAARALIVSSDRIPAHRLVEARARCEQLGVAIVKMQVTFDQFITANAPLAESPDGLASNTTAPSNAAGRGTLQTSTIDAALAAFVQPAQSFAAAGHVRAQFADAAKTQGLDFSGQPCQACGSRSLRRSRARSLRERVHRRLSQKRLYRCEACGWRGWSVLMNLAVPPLFSPIQRRHAE